MRKTSEGPSRLNWEKVLRLFILLTGIWLLVTFAYGVWQSLPVRAEEARWQAAVATEEARQAALSQHLATIKSDAYVEKIARERFRMVKPGEHLVRPLFVGLAGQSGQESGNMTTDLPNWKLWWNRFLGADRP